MSASARPNLIQALGVVWVAVVVAVPRGVAGQDRAADVLEGVERLYLTVSSLCADFRHHLSVPLLGEESSGVGRLCLEEPNLFAMRFTDPPGDVVVVDGETRWAYLPSNDPEQVFRSPAAAEGLGGDFHREFVDDPLSKFDAVYVGLEEVDGTPAHRLRVSAKDDPMGQVADLWIERDTYLLRQVRYTAENGNVRTITLYDIELGAVPPEGWFDFTPPADAVLISR